VEHPAREVRRQIRGGAWLGRARRAPFGQDADPGSPKGAWLLVKEIFGWREFANRRELAGCVGLAPTPYASGDSEIEQGISKAGNRRVRAMLVEQAWKWLQLQPDSALTQWFNRRFAGGGKRMRRVGIVALARRLVIALWRYLKHGEIPAGAVLKPAAV
jgi:transposase